MARNCKECKFHDVDYEWDDDLELEVEYYVCKENHNVFLALPFKCPYFEKSKQEHDADRFINFHVSAKN